MWCTSLHMKEDRLNSCEVMNVLAEKKYEKYESNLQFITLDYLIKKYLQQVFNQLVTVL